MRTTKPRAAARDEGLIGVGAEFDARLDSGRGVPVDNPVNIALGHGAVEPDAHGVVEPGTGRAAAGDAAADGQGVVGEFGERFRLSAFFEAGDVEHVHVGSPR